MVLINLVPVTITTGITTHIIEGTGVDRGSLACQWVNYNGYQNGYKWLQLGLHSLQSGEAACRLCKIVPVNCVMITSQPIDCRIFVTV